MTGEAAKTCSVARLKLLRTVGQAGDRDGGLAEDVPTKTVRALAWVCQQCERECIPIRSESRCICGHRLKEHEQQLESGGSSGARCLNGRCVCRSFFFIVAEGAWVLRCRCKHRHTEHNPKTHACEKAGCRCEGFHSPWVCNCDHPWSAHKQVVVSKRVLDLGAAAKSASVHAGLPACDLEVGVAQEVNRWDLLQRGAPAAVDSQPPSA